MFCWFCLYCTKLLLQIYKPFWQKSCRRIGQKFVLLVHWKHLVLYWKEIFIPLVSPLIYTQCRNNPISVYSMILPRPTWRHKMSWNAFWRWMQVWKLLTFSLNFESLPIFWYLKPVKHSTGSGKSTFNKWSANWDDLDNLRPCKCMNMTIYCVWLVWDSSDLSCVIVITYQVKNWGKAWDWCKLH